MTYGQSASICDPLKKIHLNHLSVEFFVFVLFWGFA